MISGIQLTERQKYQQRIDQKLVVNIVRLNVSAYRLDKDFRKPKLLGTGTPLLRS
jgi:hypothetical protein